MRSTEFCGTHWLYRPPSGGESPADLKTTAGTGAIVMNESRISRGFRSHRLDQFLKGRLPPGQYVTKEFPVLSAGPRRESSLRTELLPCSSGDPSLQNGTGKNSKRCPRPRSRAISIVSLIRLCQKMQKPSNDAALERLKDWLFLPEITECAGCPFSS